MCAIIAWFIRDLLDFAGSTANQRRSDVFISTSIAGAIGSLIDLAAKKPGKDGKININAKNVPRYAGVVEGN